MRFRNRLLACLCLLPLACATVACQGKIAPLVAKAGTTVILPLTGSVSEQWGSGNIPYVYGGQYYPDYQRGGLVFFLTPGDHRLVTRGTSAVIAHPNTGNARGELSWNAGIQLFSVVDIPAGIPSDVYDIEIYQQFPGEEPPVPVPGASYNGQLEVLYDDTEDFTPIDAWAPDAWFNVSGTVPMAIPSPEVRFQLDPQPWAVELSVTYPSEVITVVDALPSLVGVGINHRGVAWHDDTDGQVTISAAAETGPIDSLSMVFTLDDFGQYGRLDTGQIVVNDVTAYDQNGAPISVTVSSVSIH